MSPQVEIITQLPVLPRRSTEAHKGTFGRILVVAGSRGMSGAAVLCASGALRGGAGLVRLAVPREVLPIVAASNPCYMTAALAQDTDGLLAREAEAALLALVQANDVVAMGPGLGRGSAVAHLVRQVMSQGQVPVVLDADGLFGLQGQLDCLAGRSAATILTPHAGEFARLIGRKLSHVQSEREGLAIEFARSHGVVLLLKGHGTLVTDGRRLYRNPTGNPGMATGGTGDVLTGLIAALLGQGLEAFAAAQLGAYLHGRAGDLARDDLSETCLIASDLLLYLPRAFREF